MTKPNKLRFQKDEKRLVLEYEGLPARQVSYETLRVNSPSAEVQGHGGEKPIPPTGKGDIGVVSAEHIGQYAVRIRFDDGHETGLFTWKYLKQLSQVLN